MALPTTTISMSQVNTELGLTSTATISLNDAAVRSLAGVASGAISMDNLRGKSAATISLNNETVNDLSFGGIAQAYYYLTSGGLVQLSTQPNGASPVTFGTWCDPTTAAPNYEALVTVTSGALSGGTAGSYVALSSTRAWYVEEDSVGSTSSCTFTVQIRAIGTTTVLATATVNMSAELQSGFGGGGGFNP
jgi:hypothetical protein